MINQPPFDLRAEVKPCGCGLVQATSRLGYDWMVDNRLVVGAPPYEIGAGRLALEFNPGELRAVLRRAGTAVIAIISTINPATSTAEDLRRSQEAAKALAADLAAAVLPAVEDDDGDDRRN